MSFETPILFLIFNRPDTTQRVFEEIKNQKPKYLFVAADGPRVDVEEDIEKCKITRNIVIENIDWDCEVKMLFRDNNLGCGHAPAEAISWFFENVEQGIILEDDCLPHPSFFNFCEVLLERYKENEKIFGIGGFNLQDGIQRGEASYFFSHYSHIWGWASWRRAWKYYDHNLGELDNFKKSGKIKNIDSRNSFNEYWMPKFENVLKGDSSHIWDYQWLFAIWNRGGLVAVPNVNLISNIGFGDGATHTIGFSPYANSATKDIEELIYPKKIQVDKKADRYITDTIFNIGKKRNIKFRIPYRLKKILKIFPSLINKY